MDQLSKLFNYRFSLLQTAYENYRQRYVGRRNPYDKGIFGNIKEVLLVPMPPSNVDFQAEIAPGCPSN